MVAIRMLCLTLGIDWINISFMGEFMWICLNATPEDAKKLLTLFPRGSHAVLHIGVVVTSSAVFPPLHVMSLRLVIGVAISIYVPCEACVPWGLHILWFLLFYFLVIIGLHCIATRYGLIWTNFSLVEGVS